jgi:hypothetical protein
VLCTAFPAPNEVANNETLPWRVARVFSCYSRLTTDVFPFSQVIQFFFADAPFLSTSFPRVFSSTSHAPPADLAAGVCEVPHPFLTQAPVSRPHKMSLLVEAKRVAAEFDFSDDVVRAIGDEFVAEMSACQLPERSQIS